MGLIMSAAEPETEPEIQLTGPGAQAYEILRWVQEDIPGRAAEGQKRLSPVIAAAVGDEQARAELSGVSAYLMRYAD
jgi:hypothetical protein